MSLAAWPSPAESKEPILDKAPSPSLDDGVVELDYQHGTTGCEVSRERYEAGYRSVQVYRSLFRQAGSRERGVSVLPNPGYTAMAVAGDLVMLRRRAFPFLPAVSPRLGAFTWWALRAVSPVSFRLIPKWLAVPGSDGPAYRTISSG